MKYNWRTFRLTALRPLEGRMGILLVLVLTLAFLLPQAAAHAGRSMTRSLETYAEEIYSAAHFIRYLPASADSERQMPPFLEEQVSLSGYLDMTRIEDQWAGTFDSEAKDQASLSLLEGSWPQRDNEAVITDQPGQSTRIGSSFVLADREFIVTGVIEPYGRLWPRGKDQVDQEVFPPTVIVTSEGLSFLRNTPAAESAIQIRLFTVQDPSAFANLLVDQQTMEIVDPTIIQNINLLSQSSGSTYQLSAELGTLLIVLAIVLALGGWFIFSAYQKNRWSLLRLLGLTRSWQVAYSLCQRFCVLLFSIPLSFGLSLITLTILERVSLYSLQMTFILTPDWSWTLISMVAISLVFLILPAAGDNILVSKRLKKKQRKSKAFKLKRMTLNRFIKVSFLTSASGTLLPILLIVLAFLLLLLWPASMEQTRTETAYRESTGAMPQDYDFEVSNRVSIDSYNTYVNGSILGIDQGHALPDGYRPIFSAVNYSYDGFGDETLNLLRQIDGLRSVVPHKEHDQGIVVVNEPDAYLDMWDGEGDKLYGSLDHHILDSHQTAAALNQAGQLIPSKLQGFSEDDLTSLQPYIVSGDINLDSLNDGTSVILVVPSYIMEKGVDEVGEFVSRRFSTGQDAHRSELFEVGDRITLLSIVPQDEPMNGMLDRTTFERKMIGQEHTFRVAGIIEQQVGYYAGGGERISPYAPYSLYTTTEAFEAIGLGDVTYNVTRFYAEPTADLNRISQDIQTLMEPFPKYFFDDQGIEMASYRRYLRFQEFLFGLTMTLIFASSIASVAAHLLLTVSKNRRSFALYQLNGLDQHRILKALFRYTGLLLLLSAFVSGIIIAGLILRTEVSDRSYIFLVLRSRSFIIAMLLFVASLFVSNVPAWLQLRSKDGLSILTQTD